MCFKLVIEISLYYDAWSKKHQVHFICLLVQSNAVPVLQLFMYTNKYKLYALMIQQFGEIKDSWSYRIIPLGFSSYLTVNSGLRL
jgi:hypothetical protein